MSHGNSGAVYPTPSGWTRYLVREIASDEPYSCVAGPFGSSISSRYFTEEGIPVIRGSNLKDDLTRFVSQGFVFLSEAKAQEFVPQQVKPNDLIFTCWGTIGQVGIIPERGPYEKYIISNKQLKLRVNNNFAEPLFCFYYFSSPAYVEYIKSRGIGGAVPGINLGILKSLEIALPEPNIQRKIIEILSAYDDLIGNNSRRMAKLEEAAKLIYQEWFVRLQFPGHERARFLNGIPDGWQHDRIDTVAECLGGGTPPTSVQAYWENGDITWVTPTDVTRNLHFVLLDSERKITPDGLANSSAKIVPEHAVLLTSRASVGYFAIMNRPVCTNQGFISIVPHEPIWSKFILLQLSDRVEEIRSMGVGSTYPEVSRGKFREFKILIPDPLILLAFDAYVNILFKQIQNLKQQNVKLKEARDILLPRLMSGEIAA